MIPLTEDVGKALLAGETASIDYEFTVSGAAFAASEISPSASVGRPGDGRRGFILWFESRSDVSALVLRYQIDTIRSAGYAVDGSGLVHTPILKWALFSSPPQVWIVYDIPIAPTARSLTITFGELHGRSDLQDKVAEGPWTFTVPLP